MEITKETLVIITNANIEINSGASYARMLFYARSLSSRGIDIIFTSVLFPFKKDEIPVRIEDNIYILKGISKSRVSRKVLPVIKDFNIFSNCRYLSQLNSRFGSQKGVSFLLYPSNFALSFLTTFYFRVFRKHKVFIEKNELHLGIALNLPSPYGLRKIFFYPALLLQVIISTLTDLTEIFFDGMICISNRMYRFYHIFYKNLILVPILTDTQSELITKGEKNDKNIFRICYTGTITEKRDGIFTLLKAISLVIAAGHKVECNLYGSINDSNTKYLKRIIKLYLLEKVVNIYGNYDNESIRLIQSDQNLLVLTRPRNLQTNFGFSTKLAEYLSSGVPVLTTRHSDVSQYIADWVNGFILEKLNPELLKDKLIEILNNKNRLVDIGKKGRETAIKYFDYANYSSGLYNLLFK